MSLIGENISVVRSGKTIVSDANIEIAPGTTTALIGPNGAGKSTLLKAVAGEFMPDGGAVHIDGEPLRNVSAAALARRRSVMAQSTPVVFDFSVAEILGLGWVQDDIRIRTERDQAIMQVAADCGITHLLSRTFNTLSGGEQQRTQLARCHLQIWRPKDDPDRRYLLLDEPTSALDLSHVVATMQNTQRLARQNTGVLVIVHDLNLAARFADQIVVIHDGHIVTTGGVNDVLDSEMLSDVYQTPIHVEWHDTLQRYVVFS
ncbi:MAG: heme ABC transporter ATP-binding protein [Pseudomonadota bacterium]